MRVGTADREALMGAAKGHDWNDVLGIDWGCESCQASDWLAAN